METEMAPAGKRPATHEPAPAPEQQQGEGPFHAKAAGGDAARFSLANPPFEQFMARDEDVAKVDLDRAPPPYTRCCVRCCCKCECCWTKDETGEFCVQLLLPWLAQRSGMYPGGKFQRSRFELAPPTKPGLDAKLGVHVADVVAPPLLQGPEQDKEGIVLRVFHPAETRPEAPLGVIVYLHGGGWCICHPQDKHYTDMCKSISKQLGVVVVAPDYRLAPENPFPGGLYDAYDSLRWLASADAAAWFAERNVSLQLSRVGLCGDSAGGNFALGLATLLRDSLQADLSPAPPEMAALRNIWLALLVPALVMDKPTKSMLANREEGPLSTSLMNWFVQQTFQGGPSLLYDRRVSPIQAGVDGLPHVTVLSAGRDILADDARALVTALAAADASFSHTHEPDHVHGAFVSSLAKRAAVLELLAAEWATALDGQAPAPPPSTTEEASSPMAVTID